METVSIPKYPCLWTDFEGDVLLEAVDPGSAEWASVQQSFKRTGMCLKEVDRIQNKFLWFNYHQLCQRFLARQEEPNEQTLFYGTGDINPDIIISSKDGIDYRYANEGLWGRALYFAYDVRLSNIYSYRLPRTNLICILQVRLITGNIVHLPSDRSLIVPPYIQKECAVVAPARFDSVSGDHPSGHKSLAIYCNDRVYPEYLVTYFTDESII